MGASLLTTNSETSEKTKEQRITGAPRQEPSRRPAARRSPLHALRARSPPPDCPAALVVATFASSTALALAGLATPGARASRGRCLGRASRCSPDSYRAPSGGVSEADSLDIKKLTKHHATAARLERNRHQEIDTKSLNGREIGAKPGVPYSQPNARRTRCPTPGRREHFHPTSPHSSLPSPRLPGHSI